MIKKFLLCCCSLVIIQQALQAQGIKRPRFQTDKAIMNGFMDLRFGMFIHWGPVTLRGTEIGWSRGTQVATSDYDSLYKEFDPVLFNADKWVKAAKEAGMKYLVITAKHHDGFCLWPSAYTDYDIAATPFKKDVVGALAKSCKEQGIKFCIYYSVLDWHHPDYPIDNPKFTHNNNDSLWNPHADMSRYIIYMKNQLKELITRYHPYMFWFDGNWEKPWTYDEAVDMYNYIKTLDPDVIINNRLGAGDNHKEMDDRSIGDYATPEQFVGAMNMKYPWESCITICHQWAWKPNDKMKSLKECIDILAGTAGGNGNLLLNVSPMMDGRMEARQVMRLKEIGKWLDKYGTAIYNTHGGPYMPNKTFTSTRVGENINILLTANPHGKLTLSPLPDCKVLNAQFMGGGTIPFTQDHDGIHLQLPENLPDDNCTVIVLKLNKNAIDIPLIEKQ